MAAQASGRVRKRQIQYRARGPQIKLEIWYTACYKSCNILESLGSLNKPENDDA